MTYTRNDLHTDKKRLGFIAQDFLPFEKDFPNLVNTFEHTHSDDKKEEMYGLDYSRLVCILWGVCKNMQAQLTDSTARIAALEAKGDKKTKSKVNASKDSA